MPTGGLQSSKPQRSTGCFWADVILFAASLLRTGFEAEWHPRKKRRDRNPVLREALDFYW
jgi:hypothetical protein